MTKKIEKKQKPLTGYKGFDKDLKCNDLQYEVGKTTRVGSAELCKKGLHFCEFPLDVFRYYPPADKALNRFVVVEASDVTDETSNDSKRVAKKLKIKAEIGLPGLIKADVEYISSKSKNKETNTGSRSAAKVKGKESVAISLGIEGTACGALGCWLVLAEWENAGAGWSRKDVRSVRVDGETIKPDVYYILCGGEFVESEGEAPE